MENYLTPSAKVRRLSCVPPKKGPTNLSRNNSCWTCAKNLHRLDSCQNRGYQLFSAEETVFQMLTVILEINWLGPSFLELE